MNNKKTRFLSIFLVFSLLFAGTIGNIGISYAENTDNTIKISEESNENLDKDEVNIVAEDEEIDNIEDKDIIKNEEVKSIKTAEIEKDNEIIENFESFKNAISSKKEFIKIKGDIKIEEALDIDYKLVIEGVDDSYNNGFSLIEDPSSQYIIKVEEEGCLNLKNLYFNGLKKVTDIKAKAISNYGYLELENIHMKDFQIKLCNGIILNRGECVIKGNSIFENIKSYKGGVIQNLNSLTIYDGSKFINNETDYIGGAILNGDSKPNIISTGKEKIKLVFKEDKTKDATEFSGNTSPEGGAIYNTGKIYFDTNSKVEFNENGLGFVDDDSNEETNRSTMFGGAICSVKPENNNEENLIEISGNVKFNKNKAIVGGAVYYESGFIIKDGGNVEFKENRANFMGGAVYSVGDFITEENSKLLFVENKVEDLHLGNPTVGGGAIMQELYVPPEDVRNLRKNINTRQLNQIDEMDELYKGDMEFNGQVDFIGNRGFTGGAIVSIKEVKFGENSKVLFDRNEGYNGIAIKISCFDQLSLDFLNKENLIIKNSKEIKEIYNLETLGFLASEISIEGNAKGDIQNLIVERNKENGPKTVFAIAETGDNYLSGEVEVAKNLNIKSSSFSNDYEDLFRIIDISKVIGPEEGLEYIPIDINIDRSIFNDIKNLITKINIKSNEKDDNILKVKNNIKNSNLLGNNTVLNREYDEIFLDEMPSGDNLIPVNSSTENNLYNNIVNLDKFTIDGNNTITHNTFYADLDLKNTDNIMRNNLIIGALNSSLVENLGENSKINNSKQNILFTKDINNKKNKNILIEKTNKTDLDNTINLSLKDSTINITNIYKFKYFNPKENSLAKGFDLIEDLNMDAINQERENEKVTLGAIEGKGNGEVTPPTKPEETVDIDYLILANGDKYTDVLTATVLGNELKAPILLTKVNYIDESTKAEIERLNPKNIIISGGDGSVSEKLVKDLKDSGYKVERLSGIDRYGTAREIASRVRSLSGIKDKVTLVDGTNFPDVITISTYSSIKHAPILLTEPESLNSVTKKALSDFNISNITIGGGDASVSKTIEKFLKADYKVDRIGGYDRYETASLIAKEVRKLTGNKDDLILVDGTNFPDGITINSLAGKYSSPIHLTNPKTLEDITKKDIKDFNIKNILIGGGVASVSENTLNYLKGENIKVERISGSDRYKTAVKISEKFTEKFTEK